MAPAEIFVAIFGLLITGLGLWGLASPAGIVGYARRWTNPKSLWLAAGLRVALGVALWLAAPASRQPAVLQVLAVMSVVAGLVLPFVGVTRFSAFVDWWATQPAAVVRVWTCVAAAFGIYLIWAVAS